MGKNGTFTDANCQVIRDRLFKRIWRTGEEAKNDFPNILRTAIKAEAWKRFQDSEGRPFPNLVAWLTHSFPLGLGMGQDRHTITYEDALKLTEGAPDVHRVLAENAPKGKPGRKAKGGNNGNCTVAILDRKSGCTRKPVLAVRLAQEHPAVYDAYLRGEHRGIRAAAETAGLVKPSNDPVQRIKSNYRKLTPQQRREIRRWMDEEDE